jgi:hypothetical protein
MKDNNEEQDFDERNEDEEGKSCSAPLIFLGFKISSTRNSCYLAKFSRHLEVKKDSTHEDRTFMYFWLPEVRAENGNVTRREKSDIKIRCSNLSIFLHLLFTMPCLLVIIFLAEIRFPIRVLINQTVTSIIAVTNHLHYFLRNNKFTICDARILRDTTYAVISD